MSVDIKLAQYLAKAKKTQAKLERMKNDVLAYCSQDGKKVIQFDNMFEYLLFAFPEGCEGEYRENRACNSKWLEIQKSTDPMFKSILDLFEGSTITEKRIALKEFLDANTRLKTTNLAKLRQRIFLMKNLPLEEVPELPESPITDLLQQEPEIPIESIELNIPSVQLFQFQREEGQPEEEPQS